MAQKVETEDKICSTSILSAICGNHLQTLARYCFRTLNKLLINTTGHTSFSGLLKASEKKNEKFSKSHCKYFKISRKLLLKRFDELNDEQKNNKLILCCMPRLICVRLIFTNRTFLKSLLAKTESPLKRLCQTILWYPSAC